MLEILWSIPEDRSWTSIRKTIQSSLWDFVSRALLLPSVVLVVSATLPERTLAQQSEFRPDSRLASAWHELGDTTLERLTVQALTANNDVRAAQATVRGARLSRRLTAFDFAPTITLNSGLSRRRLSAAQLPGVPLDGREQDVYDAGFDASWELDIFGRNRNTYKAQGAAASAASEDLRDAQLSLVAELARTYFELRGAERQMAVASRNIANQKRTLQLTVDRLSAGRGTAFDRERASAQVSTTLAGVATTEAQIASARYRLSVLVGSDPKVAPLAITDNDDIDATDEHRFVLPTSPEFETVASLVQRRPDVRSADDRLSADQSRIEAARADYLPRLNIVGSVGFNAPNSNAFGMKESSRFIVGPTLSWPAFNLGRVHTRSEIARVNADATRSRRDQTLLSARAEVQSAIVAYDRAKLSVDLLRDAASSSERSASLARLRFDGGESGFLEVLDAQRTMFDAQDRLARAETAAATAYVALYKSLGGGWAGAR